MRNFGRTIERPGLRGTLTRELGIAVTVTLLIFTVVGVQTLSSSLRRQQEHAARELALRQIDSLDAQLSVCASATDRFAANTFVITSLFDPVTRNRTLPTLLGDFVDREIEAAAVTDFEGAVIAAYPAESPPGIEREAIARAITHDRETVLLNSARDGVICISPVRVHGRAQGAVVTQASLPELIEGSLYPDPGVAFEFLHGSKPLHEWRNPDVEYTELEQVATRQGSISESLGFSMRIGVDRRMISRPTWRATLQALALACILLFFGMAWARRVAARIANPLVDLCEEVREKKERVSNPGTHDELEELADAFNQRTSALLELQRDLEYRVAERTASLQEATAVAERASEAKSDFLANMSHEIRTPMTAILGYGELLADSELDEDTRSHAVSAISSNGEHLLTIINDILDISKIEAGRMELEILPTDPREIVQQVEELMKGPATDKGLALNVDCASDTSAHVALDPTRLRQIVLNLVSNAIKFTSEGAVSISLERVPADRSAADAKASLRFRVADTGCGIAPEAQARLFDPFAQEDSSTTRKFGGTGLGLYICRRLVEQMGGEIRLDSTLGEGSRFEFTLPFTEQQVTQPAKPSNDATEQRGAILEGARALLVEDGRDNQRLIRFHLEKAGIVVEVAENGREGLDAAWDAHEAGEPFDIVIMDMQMPIMSGYEATRELRKRNYAGPIVALTANAMDADRQRCFDAGCSSFASKPINKRELLDTLAREMTSTSTP